jgi:hypothetical protein
MDNEVSQNMRTGVLWSRWMVFACEVKGNSFVFGAVRRPPPACYAFNVGARTQHANRKAMVQAYVT